LQISVPGRTQEGVWVQIADAAPPQYTAHRVARHSATARRRKLHPWGILPPPNFYYTTIIFYPITLTFPDTIVLFYTVNEIPFFPVQEPGPFSFLLFQFFNSNSLNTGNQ
jgi:hypothetical protein